MRALLAVLLLSLAALSPAKSDPEPRAALETYLAEIATAFESDPSRFKTYPLDGALVEFSESSHNPRRSGTPRILRFDAESGTAVALISGHVAYGNSGDETSFAMRYSGLYLLTLTEDGWRIGDKIPFAVNRMLAHAMDVELAPSSGLTVTDVLDVEVVGSNGFAAGLNRKAALRSVLVDGRPAEHYFQDGVLWVDAPAGRRRLTLAYDLTVERTEGGNSATFTDHYGHIRNQYWWHPFFGFGQDRGAATFDVTVRTPQNVRVALDLPQQESSADGGRTIKAQSAGPVSALTLAYDDAWAPTDHKAGPVTLSLFATPDYAPAAVELQQALARTWDLLSERFGTPPLNRIAVVQARGRQGSGWHFSSNQAIFTGVGGGDLTQGADFPVRAYFSHEVAHLWTRPSGATRNFLAEGWATYTESLVIRDLYGRDAEQQFWRDQARLFANNEAANRTALNADRSNNGVSYAKGAWVLAMLETFIGTPAFDRGVRAFVAQPADRTSYEDFLDGFGPDRLWVERFLAPWVEQPGAAQFTLEVGDDGVFLVQAATLYWLPDFSVRINQDDGDYHIETVQIEGRRTRLDVAPEVLRSVELDPFGRYLLSGARHLDGKTPT